MVFPRQFQFGNQGFPGGAVPQHVLGPPGLPDPFPFPNPNPGQPPQFPFNPPGRPLKDKNGGGDDPFRSDFIKELFGEEPRLAFFGELEKRRQNFTPIQRGFFPTQFNQFQNRFFGQLGNQIQSGTPLSDLPTFSDFLGGINFRNEFRSLPPSLRPGSSTARFRPPTQFRF